MILPTGASGRLAQLVAATSELTTVSTAVEPPPDLLDVDERGVLELVATGYTNREIADRLRLSINSVESSIRTACRKIGVTTRAEAARWGLHHGAGC